MSIQASETLEREGMVEWNRSFLIELFSSLLNVKFEKENRQEPTFCKSPCLQRNFRLLSIRVFSASVSVKELSADSCPAEI